MSRYARVLKSHQLNGFNPVPVTPFHAEMRELMQRLSNRFADVCSISPEQWENHFGKDSTSLDKIATGINLMCTYDMLVSEHVSAALPLNVQKKKKGDYLRVLLTCLTVEDEHDDILQKIHLETISTQEAHRAVATFRNEVRFDYDQVGWSNC